MDPGVEGFAVLGLKEVEKDTSDPGCMLITTSSPYKKMSIFGACLDQLMHETPNLSVPFILSRLCSYIEKYGLLQQSLFQTGEESNVVEELKKEFNEFGDASLESKGNVPAVAKLLKLFLEELPEPLIPVEMNSSFAENVEKVAPNSMGCLMHLRCLVSKLPTHVFCVLKYLCHFLMQVTLHADVNGLNCTNLGLIFGPLIFRSKEEDPIALCIFAKNATCSFVSDYNLIFEDKQSILEYEKKSDFVTEARQIVPFPSSVAPVVNFKPLKVIIPHMDVELNDGKRSHYASVPTLLIEKHPVKLTAINETQLNVKCMSDKMSSEIGSVLPPTRKRKDKISKNMMWKDAEDNSELNYENSKDCELRGSKSSEANQLSVLSGYSLKGFNPFENSAENDELFNHFSWENENDSSPHPPDPKRRELEVINCYHQIVKELHDVDPEQKAWQVGDDDMQYVECDSPCSDVVSSTGVLSPFPRSASCPLSINDSEIIDSNDTLSHSWEKLFDSVEPLRSEHRLSWPVLNICPEDFEAVPSVDRSWRSCEAPLSPSAFKSYLSHHSLHLDSSIPPSPPGEQEKFDSGCLIKDDDPTHSIKQLTKKIHSLKKKIKHFDKKFEFEQGYKPSHAEKANFTEAKRLMNELYKARKDLKALKEELHSSSTSFTNSWHLTSEVHVLEDTTNCLESKEYKDFLSKAKPSMEISWDEAVRSLDNNRKLSKRPERLEDMSKEQVQDEKLAIQKALLYFESVHGKPTEPADRNKIRPLYDRYRNVKHLIRSNSFYTSATNNGISLQPIMEHEAMDFTILQKKDTDVCAKNEVPDAVCDEIESTMNNSDLSCSQASLHKKYNSSNLHELPVCELVSEHHHTRSEKRRLRKLLREFEADFLRVNGRKVQKEDKAPVEEFYLEYKFVKGRIKLLEALISKHGMRKQI